ncbi:HotDog domain-containing protein [Annulohypoxylon maeteangense]|uniref:HotDog domain-containing protein n=1 Tax=Annulohypoxylon maeteangense TaxID=1927788 RepID=UPI002007B5CA|nr:HotDog domain-containing protein [Annulohypoxylon maeteangense]KAI0888950.1 HotDog domain-containing protein [Annulohypoxylon maeteangense]
MFKMSTTPTQVLKPHSPSTNYHQSVADPLAHFQAIPWCAALLSDPSNIQVAVPDRKLLPNNESSFVHKVMNSPTTVRACVTFIRLVKPSRSQTKSSLPPSSGANKTSNGEETTKKDPKASPAIFSGGGRENGEDPRNPFLLLHALAELGVDCQSFPGIMHGGLYGVLLDEVMGTAANSQTANGAYTVRFTTNFRRAVRTPQIVLIRGRVVRKEGRKLHVRGTIEDKDGNIMAEGDGLWLDRNIGQSKL